MQSWRRFQLEPSSLRCPDEFSTSGHLGTDGSNLAATLYRLAKAEPGQGDAASSVYARMANRLSDLIGDVQEVWVDRDEKRGLLTVHVRENGTPHPARSLSDGTLRFLALSVLEQDPEFTGLLCLEEPENGIHPERIPAMLELLDAIAVDPNEPIGAENPLSQVIVNTHSPGVVGQVRDEDLLIAQHREYSRDNKRYKALVLRALPGTWRVTKGQAPVASRGALLSYLSPFQPRQSDSGSRGRVIDRKDLRQLLLPGLGAAS
jgi:predicted ATPase